MPFFSDEDHVRIAKNADRQSSISFTVDQRDDVSSQWTDFELEESTIQECPPQHFK